MVELKESMIGTEFLIRDAGNSHYFETGNNYYRFLQDKEVPCKVLSEVVSLDVYKRLHLLVYWFQATRTAPVCI